MGDRGPLSARRAPRLAGWTAGGSAVALLAAAWLAALFAPLAPGDRALANRDIALFHLPLRAAFARLAALGPPVWNPWLNGGQPLLSNPNYAAFYPPSWLALAMPPTIALNWLVIGHAALAFAGAYALVRRLGGGRPAAALAALAWSGGGAALSLVSALTLFCSIAWLPWTLAWADAALRAGRPSARLRAALAAGIALGLQMLNGEPATVAIAGLALVCLGLSAAGAAVRDGRSRTIGTSAEEPADAVTRRLAALVLVGIVVVAVALGLAAAQILPTLARLAGSARAGGLPAASAAVWSSPPARLAELAWPRFFGDPARVEEGLYFGWRANDRSYPYVPSIYPGLLLAILGLSALVRWPVPRRGAWAAAALAGAALAIGRHDPLYGFLRRAVPGLALLRYPEKFVLLLLAGLIFAGALGWQHLLAERRAGRRAAADFPLAVSLVVLAAAAALAALLAARPGAAGWLVVTRGAPHPLPQEVARGVAALHAEALAAIGSAAAVAALFALCRFGRLSERTLAILGVAVLAVDLWHYGHGLVQTLPAAAYRVPPPLARTLLAHSASGTEGAPIGRGERLYVEPQPTDEPDLVLRSGNPALSVVRTQLARLEPASGALWGLSYALDEDYDLMLTSWGRLALFVFHAEERSPELADRFLGAWNVGALALRRPAAEWIPQAQKNGVPQPARLVPNPFVLPRYRFPRRVSFHPSYASALAVARLERYDLAVAEHCVRPSVRPATVAYAAPAVLALADRGGRLLLRYRAAAPAFFVFATTYDPGWAAAVDGVERPVYPTAACQLGLELPAGEHSLDLAFREPRAGLGAAISLLTLAACAVAMARLAARARGARRPETPPGALAGSA